MTIYKKPDAQAFAENAPSSEIATFTAWLRGLGIAFDETNGFPQMEGINDVLNRITQGIKYLEQYGIPLWRSDLEYPVGASVVYNGIQYRCITQNTNAQPDLSQLSWQSAIVDNLTSSSTTQALSAKQGKVLADMVSGISEKIGWLKAGSTIIQWGFVDYNSSPGEIRVDVAFRRPFPNNCFNVQATRKMSGHSINGDAGISLIDQSLAGASFSLQDYNSTATGDTRGFTWMAIGN